MMGIQNLIRAANRFQDRPKTRQEVREHARKPKGTKSAREIGIKKWSKAVPTGLREGHAYKKRTPNPLSAGGGNTYMVNGKLVTKEAFLKEKRKHGEADRRARERNKRLGSKLKGPAKRSHPKPVVGGLKKAVKGLTKRRKK